MVKKLVLLASAIAAMAALVAPAAANATPVLKQGSNTVAVGTAITGTANNSSISLVTETGLGTLECESIVLKGTVTKNNGSEIEGVGAAGSTTTGCSFEGLETANVKNIEITKLFTNTVEGETGIGAFEAAYESEIPGGAICKFSNKGKPGTFHYQTGEGHDTLEIRRTNVTSSGCGESFLEGHVTLETSAGPVHVD